MNFTPNYNNIVQAATNRRPDRVPLYEHGIGFGVIEKLTGKHFDLSDTSAEGLDQFYRDYTGFYRDYGYDTVTFEGCVTSALPGGGALGAHVDPVIKTREDFEKYPFDEIPELYAKLYAPHFDALTRNMPAGMKAIGGVGNGVFEIAQDLMGYENLMLMSYDDPELYADMFAAAGKISMSVWKWFLDRYADTYCVCRFGDDLGYKMNTLLPAEHIREHIIPQYEKIVQLVHSYDRPFLLHSCGCIFDVFEDIIRRVKIDAKHSNEDVIAPYFRWVDDYGDRIGNFGGIDTDHLVRKDEAYIRDLTKETIAYCSNGHGGFAIGSGNSVPDYVDVSKYLAMVETVRETRGDYKK